MTINIFYVEDSPEDIFLMEYFFKNNPEMAKLYSFQDGHQLIAFLTQDNESVSRETSLTPHCILLDINLPRMDGFEVLEKIKNISNERLQKIPIIMFSSSNRTVDREKSKRLGAHNYIQKPYDYDELERTMCLILTEISNGSIAS